MRSRMTGLAACLLLSLTAAAQAPDDDDQDGPPDAARMAASRSYHARVAVALANAGTPRGLTIAALLLQVGSDPAVDDAMPDEDTPSQAVSIDPRVAQWRQQASARAGSDVVVNALLASSADSSSAADAAIRRDAASRWRAAEPDNLAALMSADTPIAAQLASASATRRFDLHYLDQTRAIAAALRAHPPTREERALLVPDADAPADELAALTASALASAFAVPLKALFDACAGPALASVPTRPDDCGHVADVMRSRSDTALGESVGLSLARRLATSPEDIAAVDAQGRRYAWRMQQSREATAAQPRDGATEFVRLLADPAIDTEQQLAERVLAGAGVPLEPPADWQPPPRR